MKTLESLKWRAAIKKFDSSKKVKDEDLNILIEAANLAATSGGLQPFKMVVVENKELQSQLVPYTYGQAQVKDASHVLVFAIEAEFDTDLVDRYIDRAAEVRNTDKQNLVGYADSMKAYISSMDENTKYHWAKSQAFLSLGTVLSAAADLRIDSCPMEGFDASQYQELLGLKAHNLMPVVILPIGYRSDEDYHSKESKVRKTLENFTIKIN